MSNMSYCRFQNALKDLRDCYDNWDNLNEYESEAQEDLIRLCINIACEYGNCQEDYD